MQNLFEKCVEFGALRDFAARCRAIERFMLVIFFCSSSCIPISKILGRRRRRSIPTDQFGSATNYPLCLGLRGPFSCNQPQQILVENLGL